MVVQNVKAQEYFSSASDFARLYIGEVEPQYLLSAWRDIPYYKGTTDLYEGRISYHGVVYDHVKLRFDQLEQRVVILSPIGNVFCIPEQEHIDWFEMDGQRFVHDPEDDSRYAALLSDGSTNGTQLYYIAWKVCSGENAFEGRKYQKVLNTKEHYTLVTPDGEMYHVNRAADVAKLFPEQKKQIKQFAKKNRLSFSKSKRESSLVKVVENLKGRPTPLPTPHKEGSRYSQDELAKKEQAVSVTTPLPQREGLEEGLLTGIPVLDNDSVAAAVASTKTKTYIVPGVKKARRVFRMTRSWTRSWWWAADRRR